MLVAGLGIPIMAALNSGLGVKLHSPTLATTILFFVGGAISLGLFFLTGGIPKSVSQEPIPLYFYFGGIFVIIYILGITWVAPKFGVGNAVSFVLLGQLISMVIIDHYGLLGAQYNPITNQL
ncbi:DMT family transporter [Methyloprofundus sp.]|uniref:DMT family transporter n=1 Tax=Methyloprofundus sp. TaxID=2020875 RepID=UPI003D14D72F